MVLFAVFGEHMFFGGLINFSCLPKQSRDSNVLRLGQAADFSKLPADAAAEKDSARLCNAMAVQQFGDTADLV